MSKNSEQPAFPTIEGSYNRDVQFVISSEGGLDKREYFAGLAMQGLLACHLKEKYLLNDGFLHYKSLAIDAIAMADEIIAQLHKTKDNG